MFCPMCKKKLEAILEPVDEKANYVCPICGMKWAIIFMGLVKK